MGERRLVGKIILPGVHHLETQWSPLRRNRRSSDEPYLGIGEHLLKAVCPDHLRVLLHKPLHFRRVGIVNPLQGRSGFN
ncbi:hypothetical protein D3C81_1833660 [compost metagenome]